jgi:hypothetical protein
LPNTTIKFFFHSFPVLDHLLSPEMKMVTPMKVERLSRLRS